MYDIISKIHNLNIVNKCIRCKCFVENLRVIQRVIKKSLVVGDETIRTIEMTANKCSMSTVNSFKEQVFKKNCTPYLIAIYY